MTNKINKNRYVDYLERMKKYKDNSLRIFKKWFSGEELIRKDISEYYWNREVYYILQHSMIEEVFAKRSDTKRWNSHLTEEAIRTSGRVGDSHSGYSHLPEGYWKFWKEKNET